MAISDEPTKALVDGSAVPTYGVSQKEICKAAKSDWGPNTVPAICICILIVELCERLAFYTFTGTQEFYLEKRGYSLAQAGGINAAMSTLCMAWAIVAGWFADVGLGRFHTIVSSGVLYAAGALVATLAVWPGVASVRWYFAGVLILVPIGTAGIKANISNFGADQYDSNDPAQVEAQGNFFNWFYLAINIGSAVAYGFLTTLGTNGGLGVPKEYGYFAAYAIATLAMLAAVGVFLSGRSGYRIRPVQQSSSLGGVSHHVFGAAKKGNIGAQALCAGTILMAGSVVFSVIGAITTQGREALAGAAFVCALLGVLGVVLPCLRPAALELKEIPDESLTAEEVRGFLKLLPMLFTGSLAFSALYNCMQFWYQQQACQMDLHVPLAAKGAQFSGSFFMIADCLGIVVATPLALVYVNPRLENYFGGRFGHSTKFGLGIAFGIFSVMAAAYLEVMRRASPVMDVESNCAPPGVKMSNLGAAWMAFPFLLMGIGEIYTTPVLMHFAYSCTPKSTQTLAAVMGLVIGAVSNSIFAVQTTALSKYVPNDLNKGNLEFGYYMNIVLAAVLYAAFSQIMSRIEQEETLQDNA